MRPGEGSWFIDSLGGREEDVTPNITARRSPGSRRLARRTGELRGRSFTLTVSITGSAHACGSLPGQELF